jgi:hypothetical protein
MLLLREVVVAVLEIMVAEAEQVDILQEILHQYHQLQSL